MLLLYFRQEASLTLSLRSVELNAAANAAPKRPSCGGRSGGR